MNNRQAAWQNLLTYFTNNFAVFELNVNGVIEERTDLEMLALLVSVNAI